jgi:ribosomal protein S18 acetylase RimI-like enzyme
MKVLLQLTSLPLVTLLSAGSLLLESVMAQARKDRLAYVYLHVQSCNTAAQRFYLTHGFEVTKFMRDYYSQLKPPHCFVLRKQVTPM